MANPNRENVMKQCKVCGSKFNPTQPLQKVCSLSCAIKLTDQKKEKKRKEERKIFKAKVLSTDRSHQLKLAQKAFNKFIRLRDKNEPCISCGRHHKGQYHAGHYRTTKAASNLRFNEDNCHKQCSVCNNHLSGNIGQYRINLIQKLGVERVESLESDNEVKKYSIDEIIEIKLKYLKLCREMEL